MQEHPLNAINRLTSAQAAANRATYTYMTTDWNGHKALFQSQATLLPDGWLQTTCDSCDVTTIRFRAVNDLDACEVFGVPTFISAMVHPDHQGARVDTYDSECKPCRIGMELFLQGIILTDTTCFAEIDLEKLV